MDIGEPIIDFQSGAMSGVNSAIDHCTIYVLEAATFTTLTFKNNYDQTRVPHVKGQPATAIGAVAPDTVPNTTSFAPTTIIYGVKSYRLLSGSMYAMHYKN